MARSHIVCHSNHGCSSFDSMALVLLPCLSGMHGKAFILYHPSPLCKEASSTQWGKPAKVTRTWLFKRGGICNGISAPGCIAWEPTKKLGIWITPVPSTYMDRCWPWSGMWPSMNHNACHVWVRMTRGHDSLYHPKCILSSCCNIFMLPCSTEILCPKTSNQGDMHIRPKWTRSHLWMICGI